MKKPIPKRIVSFRTEYSDRFGVASDEGIVDLTDLFKDRFSDVGDVIAAGALMELIATADECKPDYSLDEIRYSLPVLRPEKIICVGVNYPDRNAEYRDGNEAPPNPSLFVRFPRSFVGHKEILIQPPESEQLDYEGEIAIIIGKSGRRISPAHAHNHIAGFTLCNDGTLRDWARHAKFNVTQGKNWDSSGSMGPWIIPFTGFDQIEDIELITKVNGRVRQKDRTGRMIFGFPRLISYISTFTTLMPGDVLVCGTPTGAGARLDPPVWLKPGDVVEVEADGVGTLVNHVGSEK